MPKTVDASLKVAVKGSSYVLTGTVISALLLIATKILIARNTTKEELGAYTLSLAVASVLALFASLGVHEGIARFVSLLRGQDKLEEVGVLSLAAIQIGCVSGVIMGVFLYGLSDFLAFSVFHISELEWPLKIISFSIPFLVLAQIVNGILRGHGIITARIYCLDVGLPLFFLLLLSFVLLLRMTFPNFILAYVVAVVLAFISIASYGYQKIGLNPFLLRQGRKSAELMRFSFPLLIGTAMAMIMFWTDTLMLGRYAGPGTVGVYDVGISISRLLLFPLAALEFVFLPIAGSLHGKGLSRELAKTYQVLTKWIFTVTMPLFFIIFCYPEQVITVLFGVRFIEVAPALRILVCGFLFHAFWGPNGILMVVIGMSQEISYVSLVGAALNIMLNYILIKLYAFGIIGASIATIGTYVALNLLVSLIIYLKCGIHPFTLSYMKSAACAAVAVFSLFLISVVLPRFAWLIPAYGVFFVFVYGSLLFATKSFDAEDISLFDSVFEKFCTKSANAEKHNG